MASQTPIYGLATGVETDDLVEPSHHNRLADTVDNVLGNVLGHLLAEGVHSGWEITNAKQVSPGSGLVASCWCRTREPQVIQGLTNGAVNLVFAVTDQGSAPSGSVVFAAQLAPPGPANSVFLGTLSLDASGQVVGIDNWAEGVQRNCHRLKIGCVEGDGVIQGLPGGATAEAYVAHDQLAHFRVPGELRVEGPDGFRVEVFEWHRGDRFGFRVTNEGGYTADFAYHWRREGFMR